MEDLAMRRDPSEFRARFNAYKNGKSVSELYNGGLPTYAEGKDNYADTVLFLKQHEGFKDHTYLDGNGVPTIGYGFTDPALVKQGKISEKVAQARLRLEIITRDSFLKNLKNWDKLGEGAKTALRSYYYNYPAGFRDTTKFMKAWNAGNYEEAIRQVDAGMNDAANPGLRKRRLAEQELLKADPFLMPAQTPPAVEPAPIIAQPVSTAVRSTIPLQQTIYPTYDNEGSPYVTGKPMVRLQPRTLLPDLVETLKSIGWKPGFKGGKLPEYGDGLSPEPDKVEAETVNQKRWLYNWLQNRSEQLANNIDTYNGLIYRGSSMDRFHVTPLPILNSINKYRLHNAKNIAKEQTDHANSVPIYDLRIPGQYLKAQDMSYNLLNFLLKKAGTLGAWFSPTYENGFKDEEIFIAPERGDDGTLLMWDKSAPLHELVHSATSEYLILQAAIDKILGGYTTKRHLKYKDKYLDDSSEVYSRLMLFRYDNKLKPNQKITKQHIQSWRNNKNIIDKQFIHRYDDNTLLKLFNEVATNSTQNVPFNKKDDGLFYASNGKSPIYIKPANRGKFTALKKRTGHSASWFKKNGTPAQKKMATFALNSKHWNH